MSLSIKSKHTQCRKIAPVAIILYITPLDYYYLCMNA